MPRPPIKFSSRTVKQLRRLLAYLPAERFRALLVLVPLSIVPGLIDLATVAMVARLMGSLVGSDLKDTVPGVKVFGGNAIDQSLWLIVLLIALSWVGSLSKLGLQFCQQRLTARIWIDLCNLIHSRVLAQGYEFHLSRSTSKLSTLLLSHIKKTSNSVVNPLLRMVGSVFSILLLSLGVLVVGRWLAVVLISCLVAAYLILSLLITPYLRHASKQKLRLETRSAHILAESLGSIRDIRLTGSEPYFRDAFVSTGEKAKQLSWASELLPVMPRMLIEPFGITLIFAVGAVPALLSGDRSQIVHIVPFLATMAVVALRLTPPLQDFFSALTQLRAGLPVIEKTLEYLDLPQSRPTLRTPGVPTPEGIFPNRTIRLNDIWYSYPGSQDPVLKGVTLSIPVGSRIALVGSTGSGKTTTAHLLLGLLTPSRAAWNWTASPSTIWMSRPGRRAAPRCPNSSTCWMRAFWKMWPSVCLKSPSASMRSGMPLMPPSWRNSSARCPTDCIPLSVKTVSSSPEVSVNAWPWPVPSIDAPASCSSTKPRARSTTAPRTT